MTDQFPITRALISVSDKTDILELARFLSDSGVELLSTGGTSKLLANNNIKVTEVSAHTHFPEIMGGRVKTLHPKIHGGILGRRGTDDAIMEAHHIPPIDLVVVNLYPFEETIANPDCTLQEAIENVDIGGPTLIRAAAKNHAYVTVITEPGDYPRIITELRKNNGFISDETRFDLAVKAFEHTAYYDGMIANFFGKYIAGDGNTSFPRSLNLQFNKVQTLRYGENPHQAASFYREPKPPKASIATAAQLQGKALSYNNFADADAALECMKQFNKPACVIVKHANPCGAAIGENIGSAYDLAFKTDPTSAFGGIIAFNRPLDKVTASTIIQRQFVEVIIAPDVEESAKLILSEKPNVRILISGQWKAPQTELDFKRVTGGLLVQDKDLGMVGENQLKTVTERTPTTNELRDLQFAWRIAKFVKSNAIVYAKNQQTIGVGAGQMSRVYSARIAGIKAEDEHLEVKGAVMASDAFFPFRDSIDAAHTAGITAVIQPGGSVKDDEVIKAADEHGIAMVFTDMRHFRH